VLLSVARQVGEQVKYTRLDDSHAGLTNRRALDLLCKAPEARGSNAKVDYLAVRDSKIVLVEVKSGSGGSLRSLHLMLDTYPNCPEDVVLYSGPFAHRPEQRLTFMPLYYAGSLGDPRPPAA